MLGALFSIVVCFGLGYWCRQKGIFHQEQAQTFIDFVIKVAFPSLIIVTLQKLVWDPHVISMIVAGWGLLALSIAMAWGIGKFFGLCVAQKRSMAIMSTFGNTSFIGFPFITALMGSGVLGYAVLYDQFVSFLVLLLVSPLILGGKIDRASFKALISFPPFVAMLLGLALRFVNLPLWFWEPLTLISHTVIPLVLMALGITFNAGDVLRYKKEVMIVLAIKMVVLPMVLWIGLVVAGIELTPLWRVAILETAMPPMVVASLLVINHRLEGAMAVTSVGIGILVSFVTLPLWFYLMAYM